MKNISLKSIIAIVVIAISFNGCDSANASGQNNYYPYVTDTSSDIEAIDIIDVQSGYQINGYVANGEKAGVEVITPTGKYTKF